MKSDEVNGRMEGLPEEPCLVEQAKSGDSEAFAQLYDATLERVFRYIFFRVSDQQTAEDLTSQVFLKTWEKLGQYRMDRQMVSLDDTVVQDGGAGRPEVVLEAQISLIVCGLPCSS